MIDRKKLSWLCSLFAALFAVFCFNPTAVLAASGTFTVVSPGTGDVWAKASTQTIQWNYTGNPGDKITITLVKDNKNVMHIASKTDAGANGSGHYTWTIPSTLAEGSDYQIKIVTPLWSEGGLSGYFTIGSVSSGGTSTAESTQETTTQTDSESFTVISPGDGDIWAKGSTQTIQWNYTGDPGDDVTLTLAKDKKNVIHIASKTDAGSNGSGSYTWSIPSTLIEGSDYQIKVSTPLWSDVGWSEYFTIGSGGATQQTTQGDTVLIDDSSFVTLTALKNDGQYNLEVKANNASTPVEVSYLVLNPNTSPATPSQGIEVSELSESESAWGGAKQYYGHTEVGGWTLPEYQQNQKVFTLPHYRTCVMMLARYEKIYVVFMRENDGQLSYEVFQGGAFKGLEVPGLAQVVRSGEQFQIHSLGSAVEVGIWDKGSYQHDEVTGWAQTNYQANDKLYPIPKYGMFMMLIGRYGNLGLIMGNYNDGQLGTVCFSGSKLLGAESVAGLCEINSAGSPHIRIRASGNDPVEVSQFAFDNTCWQWEVNGWGQEGFRQNPQVFPLKHYTPGFLTCSRYDKLGIFFYNENDAQMGVLPLSSSTQYKGSVTLQNQQTQSTQNSSGQDDIRVFLNGQLMSFDQPPVIIGGSTMVPMRAIFEALGASISWDASTQMVTATRGDITIKLIIGMQTCQVNGHETALSQPAQIFGGRTMVPLRFVAEALQAEVEWDGSTRTITITQNNITPPQNETTTDVPSGQNVIRQFFSLVGNGDADSAVSLLKAETLGDDSSQEMWRNNLNSFTSASVMSIEESNKADWPGDFEQYKVMVSLQVKPGGQTLWMDGANTFWISIVKTNSQWKIQEIATGP